ncbi:MAG: hypothetical protein PHO33_00330 [Clostridia bacterium]|nr:hypothetical protein [Clostridia bacterium]
MQKISVYAGFVFRTLVIFVLSLLWSRFYISNQYFALLVSLILTTFISVILVLIKHKKAQKIFSNKKEEQHIKACINQFVYSLKEQNLQFFYELASKKYNAIKEEECIFIAEHNGVILVPAFSAIKTTSDIIIKAYALSKKYKAHKAVVCSKDFDNNAITLSKQLDDVKIYLLDDCATYTNLLKPINYYPEITVNLKFTNKITFREFLNLAFNKSKTKSYIFMAIFLLLAGFIVRYNLYYIISATILMLFALFSYFNKEYNVIIKEDVF